MEIISGLIFDIKRFAIHDGPGIRTTVFFKGCPLNCWWCHNPESQKTQIEEIEKVEYLKSNKISESDSIGNLIHINELMNEILQDLVFYEESNGGVTFSGGEALMQPYFLYALLKACKSHEIHTTLDTCGYAEKNIVKKSSKYIDLFLYDIKFIDEKLHEKYTGVSNKLILDNLEYLKEINKEIIIRIPIIPEITDTDENLCSIGKYLSDLKVKKVNILSYNRIGIEKYRRLNIKYKLPDLLPPTGKRLSEIKNLLEDFDLSVKAD